MVDKHSQGRVWSVGSLDIQMWGGCTKATSPPIMYSFLSFLGMTVTTFPLKTRKTRKFFFEIHKMGKELKRTILMKWIPLRSASFSVTHSDTVESPTNTGNKHVYKLLLLTHLLRKTRIIIICRVASFELLRICVNSSRLKSNLLAHSSNTRDKEIYPVSWSLYDHVLVKPPNLLLTFTTENDFHLTFIM
jgi:hypothetical protein